ncbi:MAG: hypothetical protein HY555_06245 [Euryarchaeota archaeon]|nr:hypothetical protein [Euryarchaeota archaeon]
MRLDIRTDGAPEVLDVREVAGYLRGLLPIDAEVAGEVPWPRGGEWTERLAAIRVRDFSREMENSKESMPAEIAREAQAMGRAQKLQKDLGNVYEGFGLARLYLGLLKGGLVVTSRMVATWNPDDRRYHGRTIICHYPLVVVSTTGLVEAPAKPKEYYIKLFAHGRARGMGLSVPEGVEEELSREFAGRFLDYDDGRTTEVVKGYALQGTFYLLGLEPFCPDRRCRLYNAHTQEELLEAQMGGGLCERHRGVLDGMRRDRKL